MTSPLTERGGQSKTCFKCNRSLPRTEFYRHSAMLEGVLGKCKECTKRDVSEREARLRQDPEWMARERQRCVRKQRVYNKRVPSDKRRARVAVSNAVQRGKIVKPSRCERCHTEVQRARLDAHHEDYSRPLDVRWLCRRCHTVVEGKARIPA